jgi:hypothetical protein
MTGNRVLDISYENMVVWQKEKSQALPSALDFWKKI